MSELQSELFSNENITLENILKRIKKQRSKVNLSDNRVITGIQIDTTGTWFKVMWSNDDVNCFMRLDDAVNFMHKRIPV